MGLIVILMITIVVIELPNVFADVTVTPDRGSGSPSDNCTQSKFGCYSPGSTIVAVGQKVIFSNTDSAAHTFTAGSAAEGPTGEFDTSTVTPGKSYIWTANVAGEIPYFCMVHPWMNGIVIVQEKSITTSSKQTRSITNDPNKLDWSIIFVTTTNKCYFNHEKALDFYSSLTKQYLNKFGFPNRLSYSECISRDEMFDRTSYLTKYTDLTIVMIDKKMSGIDQHVTSSLGHYGSYDVKSIVSQADTYHIEDENAAWILSHELAHFALDWKGYKNKIIWEAVHKVEKKYRECKSKDTTLTHCSFVWDKITTPSGKSMATMSPDYVIQVAESMKPKVSTPKTTPIPSDSNQNKGKTEKIHTYLIDYNEMKDSLKSQISDKIRKYQKLSFQSPLGNAKHTSVLNQLRTINFETTDYNVNNSLKNWTNGLKTIGENGVREEIKKLYGVSNKIKQLDSEITKAYDLESEYISKKFESQKKVNKDADYWNPSKSTSSTTKQTSVNEKSMNPSLYVIGMDGKKAKEITIKPNERFTVEGYIYNNHIPQKYTSYKIHDNVGNSRDGTTNGNGFFKHIFTSEHSTYQNTGQGNNKASTLITTVCISSNCERVTVFVRGDDYESNSDTSKISGKLEIRDLQILAYDNIDYLKNGIDKSKKSLENTSSNSDAQKEKINQAWNLLKNSQEKLKEIESRVRQGDVQYGYGNYENAKTFFSNNEKMSTKLGENLKEISKLIEEATTPKTCVLFWCW